MLPKATIEDPNDPVLGWTAQKTAGPTHLQAYSISKIATGAGRTDVATVTNASSTIADASITAADFGKSVQGVGIPNSSFVGTVTPGTSFVLSSTQAVSTSINATAAGTSVFIAPFEYPWRGAGTIPTTAPTAPTVATATTGGTLAALTYTYQYAYTSDRGEGLLSTAAPQTTTGGTSTVTVTPAALPAWATGVNIYGRVAGTIRLLQSQPTAAAWTDTGSVAATGRSHAGLNEAKALENH
jgi:hypothetical protein